jgi:hypothetical protein
VPAAQKELVTRGVTTLLSADAGVARIPRPLVTGLEDVVPWLYSWPNELPGKTAGDA